eukprot:TRINITY_DN970_c0_g1_i2.p1 TRINITY_DN970_c0_g1~~TRINITY_DN970_c0_g1_i2.p1  ORF type:complete len:586 (+),score=114.44 TRINITY_DN970_c0_g1_i2:41-1798(+)
MATRRVSNILNHINPQYEGIQNQHTSSPTSIFEQGLGKNAANYSPLTPLSFLVRAAQVFPNRIAWVNGDQKATYTLFYERVRRLASALSKIGVKDQDTVAMIAANTNHTFEAHFGVPMLGAILNANNVMLDSDTLSYIVQHGEAKVLIYDREFAPSVRKALQKLTHKPIVIRIDDPVFLKQQKEKGIALPPHASDLHELEYEEFISTGDPHFQFQMPSDEWNAIALNYTSGTTGRPKGVVYHHRGAYLNALGNLIAFPMKSFSVFLWTLPMFHCNGWCFPWSIVASGSTSICLRKVVPNIIWDSLVRHKVTHFCAAPVVLTMLLNAPENERKKFNHKIQIMTAGQSPPAVVIEQMEALGFVVSHAYGLTEVYGPACICDWQPEWSELSKDDKSKLKSRQGVCYSVMDAMSVVDPLTLKTVSTDPLQLGEIMFRGNTVMKGYLKDSKATNEAFAGGWFHSGDLSILHPDQYVEIKDRSKDIIISGGENISTVEVEGVIYRHPAVLEAAVVSRPDVKYGETPCAFVTLKSDDKSQQTTEHDIIKWCRQHMAGFKCPKTVIFGPLPKTATGKMQKFVLRQQAKQLGST